MFGQFKQQWREFSRVAPGARFKSAYRRRDEAGKRSLVRRVVNLVAALVAFVLGVIFSLVPGVPGFVFIFLGAILLATESFRAARFLDWLDLKMRALWARVRGTRRKIAPAGSS
jgi:hypothetical protein